MSCHGRQGGLLFGRCSREDYMNIRHGLVLKIFLVVILGFSRETDSVRYIFTCLCIHILIKRFIAHVIMEASKSQDL